MNGVDLSPSTEPKALAQCHFQIDCLTYPVLSKHLHIVLRSRPDAVAAWSDVEFAQRWLRFFPNRRKQDGSPENPTQPEIDMIVNQPDVLAERRQRLSNVSWWMRCTAENIRPCPDGFGRRASLKWFLSVSLACYLELLDWTGRQLHAGKVRVIPEHLVVRTFDWGGG